MKATAVLLSAAMVGSATAGVHKMKLQKIPLDEQLKSYTMHDMTKMLGQKYGQHKLTPFDFYMKNMFANKGGHHVPVNNYMNAQCKSASVRYS
jgi:saccharopepsin